MGTATGTDTPRSGSSGDMEGPASSVAGNVAVFSDSTGKVLEDSGVPAGIGTYTWAELQLAYPHNGAGLLALPANTMVMVVEPTWRAMFIRNAAGTYWTVLNRAHIVLDTTLSTGDKTGNDQVVKQALLPAGILRTCKKFAIRVGLAKDGATDATTASALRLGTAGTTADVVLDNLAVMSAANRTLATSVEFVVVNATTLYQYGPANNSGWNGTGSGGYYPLPYAISNLDTNALYLSVCMDMAGTTNAPQVHALEVELFA